MTTAKARYEPQIGEFVDDVRFDEMQLATLRAIRDDDAFVDQIRKIATLYGCLFRNKAEELSAGEFRATLEDLRRSAADLEEKLENLPQAVDTELWRFTIDPQRNDPMPRIDRLKILLNGFIEETEDALERNKESQKAGAKI